MKQVDIVELLGNVRVCFECIYCTEKLSEEERKKPAEEWSSVFMLGNSGSKKYTDLELTEIGLWISQHFTHPDVMLLPCGKDVDKLIEEK